jgi:hypothetical protein
MDDKAVTLIPADVLIVPVGTLTPISESRW